MKICEKWLAPIMVLLGTVIHAQQEPRAAYDSILELPTLTKLQKVKGIEEMLANDKTYEELKKAEVHHEFAKYLFKQDVNIDKAISNAEKAASIRKKYFKEDPSLFKSSFNNYANFQYEKGAYLKALKTCDSLLGFCDKTEVRVAKVNWLKARIYGAIGDYKKALDCYAVSELIYVDKKDEKRLLKVLKNVLAIYADFNDVKYKKEFFHNYEKIKILSKSYDIPKRDLRDLKLNLGSFYDTMEEYDLSIETYQEALQLSVRLKDSLSISKSLNNLGVTNKKKNNIEEAIRCFEEALGFARNISDQRAKVFDNIGDVCLINGKYQEALFSYQKAISLVTGNTQEDYGELPNFQDIELSIHKKDILDYLTDKANAWIQFWEKENNQDHLDDALETLELADKVVDLIYFESREDFSKLFWREKASNLYQKTIETCYELNQREKAFYYIEKSKALLLLENVTNLNAKTLANLPDEVVEREYALLYAINNLKGRLFVMRKQDDVGRERTKREIFSKKNEYSKFIDSLEATFPKYHNFKKGVRIYNAKMVQEHLKEEQVLLQYKIGTDKSYVSLITKKEINLFQIKQNHLLRERISEFQEYLRKPFVNENDEKRYKMLAYKLYRQLLPFMEKSSQTMENKKLLIVADGILQNIPFEPLVMKNVDYPINESYMLNFYEISYAYSFSSLVSASKIEREYSNNYFAMSPTYFKDEMLVSLIAYDDEMKKLEEELQTKIVTNQNATRQKFKEAYGRYKIIHLSTHGGGSSEEQPWLAFHDDKLMLDEMYFTSQSTDLVVLSACKTSRGELKKGEGVMSIARGFVNSGAQSVLASLWDIDLKANNEITYAFYEYLNDGKTKSGALRLAKMDYLERHGNTSEASPYYWSAITLIGNDAPVFKKKNKSYLLLLLLVPVWVVYKRRKRRLASA